MIGQLFSLAGRSALVTGGSRGIGHMIAEGFLAAGAKVYISSRKADQCEAAAAALSAVHGGRCIALPQDVSTVAGCQALAAALQAHEDGLDILVNNAGASWGADFDDFPERGWDKVVDLNLKTPFFLTQAVVHQLAARASAERPAKVINISSMDSFALNPVEAYSYPASKAGLNHLTRRMAARLIERHIVVSAIAPGNFASDMNFNATHDPAGVAAATPAGRLGTAEDIAGAAIFLASRAGDFVVGQAIAVDGGIAFAKFG